jgi:molybdate transport system regulatory protein
MIYYDMKKTLSRKKSKTREACQPCVARSSRHKKYELKGRLWIEGKDGTFLGYGRVVLLERIRQYSSITEAAKSMNMSYRHAWELVESMNRQSKKLLVETATGGMGGGGARLTEAGERAIEAFWRLYERFKNFLEKEVLKMDF